MNTRILIIEDEAKLVDGLRARFLAEGYEVDSAPGGKTGLAKAVAKPPDLILLDLMLPDMDGLEVCREWRRKGFDTPVIMLTAKGDEVDKVIGLEVGADDYMTKPFGMRELLARIRVQLRRAQRRKTPVPDVLRFGEAEVDFARLRVKRAGRDLDLTALEAEILKYLVAHRGDVVSREALLGKIWGYERFPTTRTIDNHILKLRKKIELDPARPEYILSVYGGGYRFGGSDNY